MIDVLKLNLTQFIKTLQDFFVIDIRSKQAFCAAHLKNSYHTLNEKEILKLLHFMQNNETNISTPPPNLNK